MARRNDQDWVSLSMRSWWFGMEAAQVIGLRTLRMMQGGPLAQREFSRMVSEKASAGNALWWKLGSVRSMNDLVDRSLDVAGPRVRRNRKRLSR